MGGPLKLVDDGTRGQVSPDGSYVAFFRVREGRTEIWPLHEALERPNNLDTRQGRIVELHFFGGLSFEEIASVLKLSERTVKRDWALARISLFKEMSD